jgi:eukaryotic-like serine/threonine-protein kinase
MSQTIIQHYSNEQLRSLLDGNIGPRHELETTMHIATCETCRCAMERLAADKSMWCDISLLFSNNEKEAISDDSSPPAIATDAHRQGTSAIKFLLPSDNPAMLGRLGVFDVMEVLGHGGMGVVFKGYDYELNRYVAIKVLSPHLMNSDVAKRRFVRESQAAAAILHPNVVPIHSVSGENELPFFVMAYIPGESLQHRIAREGALPVADILRVSLQIAEGLAAAHSQGLVHRDIKPANILLEKNADHALIVDFGLARNTDDATVTLDGKIAGTPEYMSPEQARGETVDARTDLFSLGCVMYAMATGAPPHRADSPFAVMRKIVDTDSRPVHSINPEMPSFMSELIQAFLIRDPDSRIQTSDQAAEMIRGVLAHIQHPSASLLPEMLTRKPSAKKPYRRIWLGVTVAALIGALSTYGLSRNRPKDQVPESSSSMSSAFDAQPPQVTENVKTSEDDSLRQRNISSILEVLGSEPSLENVVDRTNVFLQCVAWDDRSQRLELKVEMDTAKKAYEAAYNSAYIAQADQCEIRNRRRDMLKSASSSGTVVGFDPIDQEAKQKRTLEIIDCLMQLQQRLDTIALQFEGIINSWESK